MGTALLEKLSVPAPERSLEQRLDALERANAVRSYRARLKRDMKAGRRSPADVLVDPEPELATMKVMDLLLATPKWGRVKVAKTLKVVEVSPSKTVGGLSDRQRNELVRIFGRGRR